MLRNKKFLQLVVSAALALAFVNIFLGGKEGGIEKQYDLEEVVSASRDIPPHSEIAPGYLTVRKVPRKFLEPGAIVVHDVEEALKQVVGKVAMAPIPMGASVLRSNIESPSVERTGVAPLIPMGKRGYVLRLGNTDVADLILPGNRVDVLATFTVRQGDSAVKQTTTILQNILVVSVGKILRDQAVKVPSKAERSEGLMLTLAIDPREAERLAQAQSAAQGEISVIVRRQGDEEIHSPEGAPQTPK